MTYTINGKEYTEFDINKRCAELMGIKHDINDVYVKISDEVMSIETGCDEFMEYCPCYSPVDTWPIIEKCWGELMSTKDDRGCGTWTHWDHVKWQRLMNEHNCTKLVAACICYIELNEEAST